MRLSRALISGLLCLLPFLAVALAGARPLHDLPGRELIGVLVFLLASVSAWRLGGSRIAHAGSPGRNVALAGSLLLAPWMLIALLWVGLGAPFQASAIENEHRYVVLIVNALLVGSGLMILRDALHQRGEDFWSSAMFAAAVPASGLYLSCIAVTWAQAAQAVQGDRTPVPVLLGHLYDVLEFFACGLTYLATALACVATSKAGLLGVLASRVLVGLCALVLVLLALHGIEFPEISGQTVPWYTQPGVIVRIPAIPWLMLGVLGAMLLRRSGDTPE